MSRNIENMSENYTFTKDTYVNDELESSVSYDFNNKNNIIEVLDSMLSFLQAAGFNYVDRLTAEKSDGEKVSSGDDIEFHLHEILEEIISMTEYNKKPKVKAIVTDENEKVVKVEFPNNDNKSEEKD